VRGAAPGAAKAAQITGPTLQAHNTFAQPNAVVVRDATAGTVQNGVLVQRFAPASVTRLQIALT
jgi:alpha-L-arabinofuranosidase